MKKKEYIKKDVLINEKNTKYIQEISVNTTHHQEIVTTSPLHNNPNVQNEVNRINSLSDKHVYILENPSYIDVPNKKLQEGNSRINKLFKVFSGVFRKK